MNDIKKIPKIQNDINSLNKLSIIRPVEIIIDDFNDGDVIGDILFGFGLQDKTIGGPANENIQTENDGGNYDELSQYDIDGLEDPNLGFQPLGSNPNVIGAERYLKIERGPGSSGIGKVVIRILNGEISFSSGTGSFISAVVEYGHSANLSVNLGTTNQINIEFGFLDDDVNLIVELSENNTTYIWNGIVEEEFSNNIFKIPFNHSGWNSKPLSIYNIDKIKFTFNSISVALDFSISDLKFVDSKRFS